MKITVMERDLTITRWDQFIALVGLALGIYGLSYLMNTQDDLRFWFNQQEYTQTEFTVTQVKRESFGDNSEEIILVGIVASTNQEIKFTDWLIVEPRVVLERSDYSWQYLSDRDKVGQRFPIWFANESMRIYYVSEFAEKPTDARALQCLLLNLTYFGSSLFCLASVFRKAIRLHESESQANSSSEGAGQE